MHLLYEALSDNLSQHAEGGACELAEQQGVRSPFIYVAYLEGCEVCLSPGPHNTRRALQLMCRSPRAAGVDCMATMWEWTDFSAFSASIIQSDTGRNPTITIQRLMASRRLVGVHMFTV